MKKVLCFGDSNTFGYIPGNGKRYDKNTRWTGILQELCLNNYKITEAGANNRNGFIRSVNGASFTGFEVLPELLKEEFDIVIIAIGINDLQKFYNPTDLAIKAGISRLINIVRKKLPATRIIVAAPSKLKSGVLQGYFGTLFNEISIEKSLNVSELYKEVCENENCEFIDLNSIAEVSEIDGLHYDKTGHRKIAEAIYDLITA